jgi:hypothetical protein
VLEEAAAAGDAAARGVVKGRRVLSPPFQLLYLGILAYVGNSRALAQVYIYNLCCIVNCEQ